MAVQTVERKKRDNGEGTIRQRADGRWEWKRCCEEDKNNGKPIYRYGKTRQEVIRKKREYLTNLSKFGAGADDTVLWELAEHWMRKYKYPNLRGSSRDRLDVTYYVHIKPDLGFMVASQMTADDIQDFINVKAKTLSYSYIKKLFQFLNGFFSYLMQQAIISKNPCDGVILPKQENMAKQTKKIVILSEQNVEELYQFSDKLKTSTNHFYKYVPAFVFYLNTGLRCAEGLALEWEDIDFENNVCKVNKILTWVRQRDEQWNAGKREKLISVTKTVDGTREVPLNAKAIEALRQIQAYNERMGIVTTHVISSDVGEQITERSILRSFKCVLGMIEAPDMGLHGLRHTFASTLLRKGVDIAVVSKLLGHKDIAITYKTYIHIIEQQKRAAMNSIPAI